MLPVDNWRVRWKYVIICNVIAWHKPLLFVRPRSSVGQSTGLRSRWRAFESRRGCLFGKMEISLVHLQAGAPAYRRRKPPPVQVGSFLRTGSPEAQLEESRLETLWPAASLTGALKPTAQAGGGRDDLSPQVGEG
jgi:hypothetical protein